MNVEILCRKHLVASTFFIISTKIFSELSVECSKQGHTDMRNIWKTRLPFLSSSFRARFVGNLEWFEFHFFLQKFYPEPILYISCRKEFEIFLAIVLLLNMYLYTYLILIDNNNSLLLG